MRAPSHPRLLAFLILFPALALVLLANLFLVRMVREDSLVAFDAAFAATRPGLAAEIERLSLEGRRLSLASLPLSGGPSALVELLRTRRRPPALIVTSPLVAGALLEGARQNGTKPPSPLLVLEWPEKADPGADFAVLRSDPLPAYREAGALLGGLVADLRSGRVGTSGTSPAASGALVFAPGPGRPAEAREAFREGWLEAAGFEPQIQDLPAKHSPLEAENAVRKLLGTDLRALLVATGPSGIGALLAARDPARVIGLVGASAKTAGAAWPEAAFVLAPDETGIAFLLRSGRDFAPGSLLLQPWSLELLPGAAALKSRNIDLAGRLAPAKKLRM